MSEEELFPVESLSNPELDALARKAIDAMAAAAELGERAAEAKEALKKAMHEAERDTLTVSGVKFTLSERMVLTTRGLGSRTEEE